MVQKISFKIGRRGAVLILYAFLYVLLGYGYVGTDTSQVAPALKVATNLTAGSLAPWGVVWILVALIGFVTAFWPPERDNWGFSTMAGMAYLWGGFFIVSWVFYGEEPRGWVSGIIFMTFGAALSLIAGWPEPRIIKGVNASGRAGR
jgi:hypothetical protein